jgi:hypothetical protein
MFYFINRLMDLPRTSISLSRQQKALVVFSGSHQCCYRTCDW